MLGFKFIYVSKRGRWSKYCIQPDTCYILHRSGLQLTREILNHGFMDATCSVMFSVFNRMSNNIKIILFNKMHVPAAYIAPNGAAYGLGMRTSCSHGSEYTVTMKPPPDVGLTHWGRVTHRCVGNLTIIGSDNGLSPGRRQAIIWTNVGILLIGPLGTNFSEMLLEIHTFSFKKIHLEMSSGKWPPFCLGLKVSIP